MSLQAALKAYTQGNEQRAYDLVTAVTADEPENENAWVLLLELTKDDKERADIAERILQLNPNNPAALTVQVQQGQRDWDSEERVYEMLWDCGYCGTPKLLGKTHRFCPHCGAAQEAEKRYFPKEDEKVAVQDHQFFGADKLCPACGTANSGNAEFCQQCGSPLDEARGVAKQADQICAHDADTFQAADADDDKTDEAKKGFPWWLLAVIVLIVGGVLVFFVWTKEVSAVLTDHSWQHTLAIEQYGPKADKAWCDAMPRDAYGDIQRKREVRSYQQVPDGEQCDTRRIDQGDGTYVERQECTTVYRKEPVYDTRCYFTVDRWQYERTETAQAQDQNPYWPAAKLQREGSCRGCERIAAREARYVLHFIMDDAQREPFTCAVPEQQWRQAPVKSRWQLEVGALVGDVRCDSLQLK